MKQVTRNISLDLSRKSNIRIVFASEADYNSREFIISLHDDGVFYHVDATILATVNVKRPDGASRSYEAEVTNDGRVRYIAGRWDLDVPGDVHLSVSLYGEDDIRITSTFFTVRVEEGIFNGEEISEEDDVYSVFTEMMVSFAGMKSDEVKRVYAENQRVQSENYRAESEQNRINAEKQRRDAEIKRVSGEEGRVNEEALRAAAEEIRNIAEGSTYSGSPYYGGRQIQEFLRVEAENARVAAENARIAAENTRIANDNARAEITAMMKTSLENLIVLQEEYIARGTIA